MVLRNQTCKSQTYLITGAFSMNKPAGVVSGDLMIAAVRSSALLSVNLGAPVGWTELAISSDDAKFYYRVAGGSEPASYSFGSVLAVGATIVGSIVAFSGADPVSPFGSSVQATGTGTTVSIPSVTATRNGSVLYSNVTSGAAVNASFSSGLTSTCDQATGGVAVSNAYEALAAGAAAAVSATLTGGANWIAQAVVVRPASSCTSGGLTLNSPGAINFPPVTLNGTDRTVTTTGTLTVADQTDTASGWNVSATSTNFTSGAATLGAASTTLTGVNVTAGSPNCGMPTTGSTTFPIALPAGAVAPPASKIYSAAVGSGLGSSDLAYNFSLNLPATTRAGTYVSTWTFTLAAGP